MKERVIGVVILVVGGLLSYICVYQPLHDAQSGAESVSVSAKGSILAPLCLVGLLYIAMGERVVNVMGTREKPKPAAYAICAVLGVLGVGLYILVRAKLEALGYDFHGKF
ncbi:MAG TPA: hypothetical protein VN641_03975 [Urbifossiella sp.]|nr:hypothetical protein [Urbifossiella sp.]